MPTTTIHTTTETRVLAMATRLISPTDDCSGLDLSRVSRDLNGQGFSLLRHGAEDFRFFYVNIGPGEVVHFYLMTDEAVCALSVLPGYMMEELCDQLMELFEPLAEQLGITADQLRAAKQRMADRRTAAALNSEVVSV